MQEYALTRDEIVAIRAISDQRKLSISELSEKLRSSEGWASRVIKSLEGKGIVKTRREGMKKTAEIAEANYAQVLSELIKAERHVPWEKVLSYSNMAVLLASTTGEGDFERGLSNTTKWRALRNLSMHGLIPKKTGGSTALNSRINRFAREYAEHISGRFARKFLPLTSTVLWMEGYSCLFKVRMEAEKKEIPKHFLRTALSAYHDYGIQFITNEVYYYYEPGKTRLSLEDVILHTLLIDRGSQTYVTYALLFIFKVYRKIDFESLAKKAQRYNLAKNVEDTVRYINSNGEERAWPLPRWEELKEQAIVYGIEINDARQAAARIQSRVHRK